MKKVFNFMFILVLLLGFSSIIPATSEAYPGGVDEYCDANLGCFKVCHWHRDPDGGYPSYHCSCDCEVIK